MHVNKGKTIAQTLKDRTDYAENPDKTKHGELVTGYGCDPHVADEEFLLSKKEYAYITGRSQGNRDVLAYHIRQSFKPGEVSAEEANAIGVELAQRFFKEKHAFIVATHIDKKHVHNHIIVNSTTLDCTHKFKDFKRSDRAVRRISDLICVEHGLSIIENPKPSKGRNYGDWLGEKSLTNREILRNKINEILPNCATFDDFIIAIKNDGYEVKESSKNISFKGANEKKFTRLKSLGDGYSVEEIRKRIGVKTISTGGVRVSLLVDIQAKIQEGKGVGYEQWAKVFNVNEHTNIA